MKTTSIFLLLGLILLFACQSADSYRTNSPNLSGVNIPAVCSGSIEKILLPVSNKDQDDLKWLIGRWRCMTREPLKQPYKPFGSRTEDYLEYFNVYLPYADTNLTLALTDNPPDRAIAAEFVIRVPKPYMRTFEERVRPMNDGGTVKISRDRIWVCTDGGLFYYEFKYARVKGEFPGQLVLESKLMRLVLVKVLYNGDMSNDLMNSFVYDPIREYSTDKRQELARKYEELIKQNEMGNVSNPTNDVTNKR